MDGKQGIQLVKLIGPKLTIPVHFDDYDVFVVSRGYGVLSSASDTAELVDGR
jgi:hypothetical protein